MYMIHYNINKNIILYENYIVHEHILFYIKLYRTDIIQLPNYKYRYLVKPSSKETTN